jgi:hypothetical protein
MLAHFGRLTKQPHGSKLGNFTEVTECPLGSPRRRHSCIALGTIFPLGLSQRVCAALVLARQLVLPEFPLRLAAHYNLLDQPRGVVGAKLSPNASRQRSKSAMAALNSACSNKHFPRSRYAFVGVAANPDYGSITAT